jgi:hypothetical protein
VGNFVGIAADIFTGDPAIAIAGSIAADLLNSLLTPQLAGSIDSYLLTK